MSFVYSLRVSGKYALHLFITVPKHAQNARSLDSAHFNWLPFSIRVNVSLYIFALYFFSVARRWFCIVRC